MEKKKGLSILKPIIVILLFVLIVLTLLINIIFSKSDTPKVFGKYIHIVTAQEASEMGREVTEGAAVIAKGSENMLIDINHDVVLCKLDGSDEITIRMFYKQATDEETGVLRYYPETDTQQGEELSITKENIVGICTKESKELGGYIRFTRNIKGIAVQLILPCIILVIMLIVAIFRKRDDDDLEYNFYNYEESDGESENESENKQASPAKPLFNPEEDQFGSNEHELKKMSIAEHFSQKEVNPDSPYQKEKERTMQFKAQRAETAFASKNIAGQSATAPVAEALREEMLRRTAEQETIKKTAPKTPEKEGNDDTLIMSTAGLSKTEPIKKRSSAPASSYTPKRQETPNIDDILQNSTPSAKSKAISAMSVDDLLKVIEDEKKKL